MARYIDADKLIEHINNMPWKMDSASEITKFIFLSTVEEAPTTDVVPKSEGRWEKDEVGETLCSQCGVRPLYRKSGTAFATTFYPTRSNFCPNCGAFMKGGAE